MTFEEITEADFRDFAGKSPYKSFMQTPEIAKYRESNGWTVYYLAAKYQGKIKAASMLVAKPTFLGKSTFIAPGGPLLDLEDQPLTDFFIKNLKKYIKSHNGYILQISPYYELIERDRHGEPVEGGFNHQSAVKNLRALGFFKQSRPSQPEYMFALDLAGKTAEELMQDFKSNTRGHIRKAEKMGVTVRELQKSELGIFKKITEATSKRREFEDKPLSYYEKMYDLFVPRGEAIFLVAEVEDKEEFKDGVSKHCAGADSHFDNSHGRATGTEIPGRDRLNCCRNDDRAPSTLRNPTLNSLPLSAAMFMLYGDEVVYLFSGSDEKYMKDYNAQYELQWHMIKYAAKHSFKRYNFYGIHGLPDDAHPDGVYEFKKGFSGHVLEFIGTYELPVSQAFYQLKRFLSKLKNGGK
ncbi:MAG: peptidoglycan bridge formation glycyltransferase FemA/FemB family protein [Candidatus Saccharibacteria bacterium]|nr:peptidoglycan bridge formation glycyltransferase FemA/FemB family protein [Candidatus Saccharibacteria bacterium]